jgi:hypothetical protein
MLSSAPERDIQGCDEAKQNKRKKIDIFTQQRKDRTGTKQSTEMPTPVRTAFASLLVDRITHACNLTK